MNLIEKFENMPFQDVGTFNSIFKTTPILNISSTAEVRIGELTGDNKRKVYVLDQVLFLDLTERKIPKKEIKKELKQKEKRDRIEKKTIKINPLLKKLTPSQFVIYQAVLEAKEIYGIAELSRNINLSTKSIYANMEGLLSLGLIKRQEVASDRGALVKLSIDTDYKP